MSESPKEYTIGRTQAGGLEGLGTLWVSLQESSFPPTTGVKERLWGRLHLPLTPLRMSYTIVLSAVTDIGLSQCGRDDLCTIEVAHCTC